MRTAITLVALLATQFGSSPVLSAQVSQENGQESPKEVMIKVLERNHHDLQVRETIDFQKTVIEDELRGKNKEGLPASFDISIRNIFRTDRFELRPESVSDCPGIGIGFSPKLKKEQLPAPADADYQQKGFNTVLNNLRGELCIDPTTYGIIKYSANLPQTVSFILMRIVPLARVYELAIRYEQVFLYEAWLPKITTVFVHEWNLRYGEDYRHFTVLFENYQQRPPSN